MKLLAQLGCQFLESSFLVLTYSFQLLVLFLKLKELLKTKTKQNHPIILKIVFAYHLENHYYPKLILLRKPSERIIHHTLYYNSQTQLRQQQPRIKLSQTPRDEAFLLLQSSPGRKSKPLIAELSTSI